MNTKILPVFPYQRRYLEKDVNYTTWESLSKFSQELIDHTINSTDDLIEFLHKKNDLDVIVYEQLASYRLESARFVNARENNPESKQTEADLRSNSIRIEGTLIKKILNSPYLEDLIKVKPEFRQMILNIQNGDKIYAEKNEPVITRLEEIIKNYKKINAQHKILVEGEEMNLYRASNALKDAPRLKRRETAIAVENCREKHSQSLDELFDELVEQRHLLATQAGYKNYLEFVWDERSRVDYSPKDCTAICSAIETHFIPVHKEIIKKRKQCLGLKDIFPYDLQVELGSAPTPVYPKTQEELCIKLKQVFSAINPEFSEIVDYLIKKDRLDLEARPNKMTAMFMTYFPESRLPFIFYVPGDTMFDVHGPIHEVTHGIHAMYCSRHSLLGLQYGGPEIGELFTLSMELISSEYWDVYFKDRQNLIRARLRKLENCLGLLKMVGLWDVFQQWVYLNPDHTHEERNLFWNNLNTRFDIGITPTTPIIPEKNTRWQHRPLIYFAPFYMIEYAFAQFGAIEIYRQYRESPTQTMNNLIAAMKLGNTRSIQETYKIAGVQFDFSDEQIKKSAHFLSTEYNRLFEQLEF